jgi:hypothetical protein
VTLPEGVEKKVVRKPSGKNYTYYYWNPGRNTDREGERIKLPNADTQTARFWAEVERRQKSEPTAYLPGSIGDLIARYRKSDEFTRLSEGTQTNYEVHMRRFEARDTWGVVPVRDLSPLAVQIPAAAARTTDYLSRRCCGSPEPVALGGTCRPRSATGQCLHAPPRLGEGGYLKAAVRCRLRWSRHRIRHGRRHHRQGPPPRTGRKRETQSQAIGRSKGGMTTKILALTDALGNLVGFVLLPGQRLDTVDVPPLIEGLAFDALIADKAFDSTAIIAELDARGAKVVISQHPRRTKHLAIDEAMYNGGTSLKTSSAESRSSNASPCAPTRPTKALPP